MWKIIIKTNLVAPKEISWVVNDYKTPEVQEVLDQPYVKEVYIEQVKDKVLKNVRK